MCYNSLQRGGGSRRRNTMEKISFYMELINCNYDLYIWEYDSQLQPLHTNWTASIFSGNFLSYTDMERLVEEHISSGKKTPLILESAENLLWIAGFLYEQDPRPERCYFIGPIFSGQDSNILIRRHLDRYDLSVKLRSMIFKVFEQIPAIPGNIVSQYAVMLHYCLTNEKISTNALVYKSTLQTETGESSQIPSLEHAGIWYAEQQFCKMLSEGNPDYKKALAKSASLSSGMKTNSTDALRQHKNNSLVLLTLCSRACIQGGLSPSVSYDLNDYYASRLEECTSLAEVRKLDETMLADYVDRVRKTKEASNISAPIQKACIYIKSHLTESLSIQMLAKQNGYTEYYFSHKFKEETGISVNDYILREKIEAAKLLLSGTKDNIQTISDTLAFSNRSYFYTCFQKLVGISPSQYRSQNHKI